MEQKKQFCGFCGNQLRAEAKFCSQCGAAILLRETKDGMQGTDCLEEAIASPSEQAATEESAYQQSEKADTERMIETSDLQQTTTTCKKNKKTKVIVALVLAVAVAVASLAGFYVTADARAEQKYEAHMEAGQQYLQEQKYTEAVAEFTEALEIKDDVVKPYQLMAQAYVGLEDDASVHQTYTNVRSVITVTYEETGTLLDDAKETYMEAIVYYYEAELPDVAEELTEEIVEMISEEEAEEILVIRDEFIAEEDEAEGEEVELETAWQQIYTQYLSEKLAGRDDVSCKLFYMDDDTIPELMIFYPRVDEGTVILAISKDGKIVSLYSDDGTTRHIEGENRLWISVGDTGSYYECVYTWDGMEFQLLFEGEWGYDDLEDTESYYYYVWGESVSEEQYNEILGEAYSPGYKITRSETKGGGTTIDTTPLEMIQIITDM